MGSQPMCLGWDTTWNSCRFQEDQSGIALMQSCLLQCIPLQIASIKLCKIISLVP